MDIGKLINAIEAKDATDELQKQAAIKAFQRDFLGAITLMIEITKDTPEGSIWLSKTAYYPRFPGNVLGSQFIWRRLPQFGMNGAVASSILLGEFGFAVQGMTEVEGEDAPDDEKFFPSWSALLPEDDPHYRARGTPAR